MEVQGLDHDAIATETDSRRHYLTSFHSGAVRRKEKTFQPARGPPSASKKK